MYAIVCYAPEQAEKDIGQLAGLLRDAVDGGASVGFLPPVGDGEALEYWRGVIAAVREGTRKGGDAEKMCQSMGFVPYGEVPNYARSADGSLHTTVFYYRQLPEAGEKK